MNALKNVQDYYSASGMNSDAKLSFGGGGIGGGGGGGGGGSGGGYAAHARTDADAPNNLRMPLW